MRLVRALVLATAALLLLVSACAQDPNVKHLDTATITSEGKAIVAGRMIPDSLKI